MAEGGVDFGDDKTPLIDATKGDDKGGDTTQPFQPGAASTPYNRGEQIEMQTMQHEQTGLPSYQETTFAESPVSTDEIERRLDALRDKNTGLLNMSKINLQNILLSEEDKEKELQRVRRLINAHYPNAKTDQLEIKFSEKNLNQIVVVGPNRGETKIALDDGTGLQQAFLNKTFVKKILGESAKDIIRKNSASIQKKQKELEETRKRKAEAEQSLSEQNELVMNLNERLNKEKAKLDQLKDLPEYEEEIKRKKQLTKNLERDLKEATKERKEREKRVKNMANQDGKNALLEASIAKEIKNRDAMEERLNQTKKLDDLKEQESELQRQNAQDQAIIQDENASPSDIQAAEDRVAERKEELARLQTDIAERERARPLLDRVKEIFKKYGVTVTAVILAASVTIGAVVGTITNALKATGKALGKGLKDIGAKLGSMLPGLIGSIVNFLFKAAGQAVGFLAEHTWLLILAVVTFLFEKYLKKRR